MTGPCLYPTASLHHGHTLPMARAAELLQLAQGPALAPPGDHQGRGIKAPEHPLLPYRPGWSSREKQNMGSGLIHLCGKLSGLDTADGKNVYQEQSSQQATSQSELSPLTRPRWQNIQLRGEKIHQRHCFTSKSQDTKETQSILFKTINA